MENQLSATETSYSPLSCETNGQNIDPPENQGGGGTTSGSTTTPAAPEEEEEPSN